MPVLVGVNVQAALPPMTVALAQDAGSVTFDLPILAVNDTMPLGATAESVAVTVAVMVTGEPTTAGADAETVVVVATLATFPARASPADTSVKQSTNTTNRHRTGVETRDLLMIAPFDDSDDRIRQ